MKLVVVESPAKAKTIEKYLGPGYRVLASYGHVRDLPPKDGSVDPDHGFAMQWETYADKSRQLKAISDEAKGAESLILATDPDREGEAISWHVQEVLAKKKALPAHVERVTFNAITKSAVLEARLVRYQDEKIDRLTIGEEGTALAAKEAVEEGRFSVVSVETKPLTRNPPPPFTTSTLQQEAARKLGFAASQTMRLAQHLY